MTTYLLNSPVLTSFGRWHYEGPLAPHEARRIAARPGLVSAVGHASTARWLGRQLRIEVPLRRIEVRMRPGDDALVFALDARVAEGHMLSEAALDAAAHSFGLLRRLG